MSTYTGTITSTVSLAGISVSSTQQRTGSGQMGYIADLPVALSGELTTRTDDTTGVITLGSGHGITTSDLVDVYFSDGSVQYGCTVTAADSTTITVGSGEGDVLPAQGASVDVGVVQKLDVDLEGDDLKMFAAVCTTAAHITLLDSGGVEADKSLIGSEAWTWVYDTGVTNPVAGDTIVEVHASNASLANEGVLKIGALVDANA